MGYFHIQRQRSKKGHETFSGHASKITFCTQNTIQNILKPHAQSDKGSRSGIYRMNCLDCPLKYIGQTGRTFNIRYEEHIHDIRSNNSNSGYSNHILNAGHTYGTICHTMDVITTGRKGKYLAVP
jgi:hypothetical protein